MKAAETCKALLPGIGWTTRIWHNWDAWHFCVTNGAIDVRPADWENGPPYHAHPTTCEAELSCDNRHRDPNIAVRKAVRHMEKALEVLQDKVDRARKACIGLQASPNKEGL